MKLLVIIIFFFLGCQALSAQEVKQEEFQKILTEIIDPLKVGSYDQFAQRLVFPFNITSSASTKSYSKQTYMEAIKKYFTAEIIECLSDVESYQVALPDNHVWYMSVCMYDSEEFEAMVFTFKVKNGKWMLVGLDLQ